MMIDTLMKYILPPIAQEDETPLYLYALINAEKYKNLWVKLECEWKFQHASLFSDEALEVSMNRVAPYLVSVPSHHPNIDKIFKHYGYEGILFFWTTENFSKVLERMREFFVIYNSEGSKGYFTFYRPSMFIEIMREPSSMRDHYTQGIEAYFCEDEYDPNTLHRYFTEQNKMQHVKIRLEKL